MMGQSLARRGVLFPGGPIVDIRSLLQMPTLYSWFQRAVGSDHGRRVYVRDHVRPCAGDAILDVGCGPADVLEYLPAVCYHGIDLSERYIDAARRKYGDRATFRVVDVAELAAESPRAFDIVLANGLLHHLPDDAVTHLFRVAAILLKPEGRFVSIDGCFTSEQSYLARYFLSRDRGLHVRQPEEYLNLARQVFPNVRGNIRHDLLRIPYTHLVMEAAAASASQLPLPHSTSQGRAA